jgi:hypothetical protein
LFDGFFTAELFDLSRYFSAMARAGFQVLRRSYQGKLFAAVAGSDIFAPGGVNENLGDLFQNQVADLVAVRVINFLEVVDVGEQQTHRLACVARVLELFAKTRV